MCTPQRMDTLRPLVTHICTNNPRASDAFAAAVAGRLARCEVDYDTCHPYYRAVSVMVGIDDDMQVSLQCNNGWL